ncbi:MAG: helical backbone metal receptor [Anaerolineales bacterium]|jgi:ABC-type Fe3+-hydroxamate transport system substrate-binding protein
MSENELLKLTSLPTLEQPPERVVSLVPSITESLFGLGFGSSVVGITDYCVHPKEKLGKVTRVGGPKDPDVFLIAELKPQLVFANQEENSPETIEALIDVGIKVWVSFPKNVDECLDELRNILAIYHTDKPALQIVTLQNAVDYARVASDNEPRVKYFCPIWHDVLDETLWWMTFNQSTYAHDVLSIVGGENVFAARERLYPIKADLGVIQSEGQEKGDTRYPRVTVEEIIQAEPDVILLPEEPFKFTQEHKQIMERYLVETPAVKNGRINFLDGSLITWHGTRLGKALQFLPQYL